ncbi:hypothetical protein N8590_02635 [bacterium]|nr:hypothetical protein [bacterium]
MVQTNANPPDSTGFEAFWRDGRHIVTAKETPLCNLWLSLLRGSGINIESHGDSTGTIDELFA